MPQDAAIDYLSKECRLRYQFPEEMRNVLLSFWHERLLITGAATERHDDNFFATRRYRCTLRSEAKQCPRASRARRCAEEIATGAGDCLYYVTRIGDVPVHNSEIRIAFPKYDKAGPLVSARPHGTSVSIRHL